ncbi:hypothetical protein RHSIM_Rhsim07G0204000 [Rhododendron simsii]|uniref:Uncharacterized protein n=1 Tax=Rhododendron simsii TaxID=118357 RepID=A0A834GNW8_RHOSS|nr:hypothetical protein RHSIM_Rhsim07G0204000 [Rhododendron simsii]
MTLLYIFFWVGNLVCGFLVKASAPSDTASLVIGALLAFFTVGLIVLYFVALCKGRVGSSASPRDEIPLARDQHKNVKVRIQKLMSRKLGKLYSFFSGAGCLELRKFFELGSTPPWLLILNKGTRGPLGQFNGFRPVIGEAMA